MSNSVPLSVVMENARRKFKRDVNNLIKETNLPAFLLELVLLDALADIRENKCLELTSDMNAVLSEKDKAEKETAGTEVKTNTAEKKTDRRR